MPETINWIIKHRTDFSEKWYSDKEVDKIIINCINTKFDIDEFMKKGIVPCPKCKKPFIKVDEYNWKPDCNCFKNIRVSVG